MKSIEHIAVATDFGDTADAAVQMARQLAERLSARLSVVHVYDPAPLGPAVSYPVQVWTGGPFDVEMQKRARELLEETRKRHLAALPDVSMHALHHTSPVHAMCDFVDTQKVDLVLAGSHGRQGLELILMGSVAERIVRHVSCSALTVRGRADPATFPQRVLVCTDFSAASEPALDESALMRSWGAQITLCHVYDPKGSPLLQRAPEVRRLEGDGELAGTLGEALEKLSKERFDGAAEHVLLDDDDAAEAIAQEAERRKIDLVMVATHGRTGLSRMLIGSVAEKITRLSPCAVWAARTPVNILAG